jgi:prevent-host-death family protein
MGVVGLFEAKTRLSALLERVTKGEEITITRHGTPVAILVPVPGSCSKDPRKVAERIRALRKGANLNDFSIRQLIEEGRRY